MSADLRGASAPEPGRSPSPGEALVKGLRKAVGPEVEWIDANIVRLLLDRYDNRDGAVDEAFAEASERAPTSSGHPKVRGFDGSDLCGSCLDEPWPCAFLRGEGLSTARVDHLIADIEDEERERRG